jgi:catechol 2,3-dioxygenase-like lactoylglutathione lyase family enzyme
MIDHLTLNVRDTTRSRAFYTRVLKPLGYSVRKAFPGWVGFGDARKPYFWLKEGKPARPTHLAFAAPSRAAVDAFHAAALKAGAEDRGEPGVRPHYHEHYYGAFVVDPDGHPIEACCHHPDPAHPPRPLWPGKKTKAPTSDQRKRK